MTCHDSHKLYVGTGVRFRWEFTDDNGQLLPVAGVEFRLRRPDNVVEVFTPPSVVELAVGRYELVYIPMLSGLYRYRVSSGTPPIAHEQTFRVEDTGTGL